MRTAVICVAALVCLAVGASTVQAAPKVTFTAAAAPVPGFPGTGNRYGAGALLRIGVGVHAPQGLAPPRLSHLTIGLPSDTELAPSGFPTCNPSALGPLGPGQSQCPPGSKAGPVTSSNGLVPIGASLEPEAMTTQALFASSGRFDLLAGGAEPLGFESLGSVTPVVSAGGVALEVEPPQPGAGSASSEVLYTSLSLALGAASRSQGRTRYLLRMPKTCPLGYLPFTLDASFAGAQGTAAQTVKSEHRAACPRPRTSPAPLPPSLTLSASARPLPGLAHTGNIAGKGAALAVVVGVEGTQYGGWAPPLIGLTLALPTGTRLQTGGLPPCASSPRTKGPICPRRIPIGPPTSAEVAIGSASGVTPETASVQSFDERGGGISFQAVTEAPIPFAIIGRGVVTSAAAPPDIRYTLPLDEAFPGQPDTSIIALHLQLGAARRTAHGLRFSLLMPRRCPLGHLPFEAEATFAGIGILPAQSASASYDAPCPRHSHPRG